MIPKVDKGCSPNIMIHLAPSIVENDSDLFEVYKINLFLYENIVPCLMNDCSNHFKTNKI